MNNADYWDSMAFIPYDIIMIRSPSSAMRAWRRDSQWQNVCPWPGLSKAYKLWKDSAPLRELLDD